MVVFCASKIYIGIVFKVLLILLVFVWSNAAGAISQGVNECPPLVNNTLISPGYPEDVPDFMHCVYVIPIPPGRSLKLYFQYFLLGHRDQHASCLSRSVDLEVDHDKLIIYHCGNQTGKAVYVGGDYAVIISYSWRSEAIQKEGYIMKVSTQHPVPPQIRVPDPAPVLRVKQGHVFSCSATGALPLDISLKMDSAHVRTTRSLKSVIAVLYKGGNYTCTAVNKFGSDTRVIRVEIDLLDCQPLVNNTLTSPWYPANYTNNRECIYNVPIPQNMALKVTFQEFLLPPPVFPFFNCLDYLRIESDENGLVGEYCGNLTGRQVAVFGTFAVITFHSQFFYKSQRRGFQIVLSTVEPKCLSVVNNTATTPGYPNNYPINLHCTSKLPIPPGMALKITFQDFLLDVPSEFSGKCHDYMKITDENNVPVGTFCGQQTGKEILVGGDYALVTFHSDNFLQGRERGFLIVFNAVQASTPKIVLPDPSPFVSAFPSFELWCSAAGPLPAFAALFWKTFLLKNKTKRAEILLPGEGNYNCLANNKYGTEVKHFTVIFPRFFLQTILHSYPRPRLPT